jgi:adenine-specific DNA-methyltransferase
MKKDLFTYIKKHFGTETDVVNRLLVTSFAYINQLSIKQNEFLLSYLIDPLEQDDFLKLIEYIKLKDIKFEFENLIEYFEFVISPEDKIINGAVYTPLFIRDYIVKQSFKKNNKAIAKCLLGDFACGCGCFLYTGAKKIKALTGKSYFDIFKDNIYGLDITDYSVERTKIILSLLAITEGEDKNFEFNIFKGNALSFDWKKECHAVAKKGGFDFILSNPPYVGAKNISEDNRDLLNKWSVSQVGNPDLYIPFFQIGMENLRKDGVLGYITVNSFIRSLNGRLLRAYIQNERPEMEIIDFGNEQVFQGRSTYTCLCFISNKESDQIGYINTKIKDLTTELKFDYANYEDLEPNRGWKVGLKDTVTIINSIEKTGKSLGNTIDIRNGFATLRNSIYLFTPVHERDDYYVFIKNGKYFEVEKAICRDAIKANILKSEKDINKFREKIIFPYKVQENPQTELFVDKKNSISLIKETFLLSNYPKAYAYLLENKPSLANRDKGKKEYEEWYAYGRNQALLISGFKLLFPCYSNKPYFVLTEEKDLLFYNGYALVSNSLRELEILKKILNSSLFWFYIQNTSKPYSSNYFALSKNFIQDFGICKLSEAEKEFLLSIDNEIEINLFLHDKYNIKTQKKKKELQFA